MHEMLLPFNALFYAAQPSLVTADYVFQGRGKYGLLLEYTGYTTMGGRTYGMLIEVR